MIIVETDILIPNKWDELSEAQAIDTVALIEGFFKCEYDITEFRLQLLKKLTGYKPDKKKYKPEIWEQITFNLYHLSELLTFPLKPYYHNPEILEVLSPELREKLQNTLPIDINNPSEIQELETIAALIKWEPGINLTMNKNPIPKINGMQGPVFDIDENGIVTTDIIAAEYVDAYEFFNLYRNTKAQKYLNCLISALYRQNRKEYSTFETQQNAIHFNEVSLQLKKTVFVWFQSFLEYLYERSEFTWLFNRTSSDEKTFSLGIGGTIYQLSSQGYGSKKEVEMMPLQDYLSIQVKELTDAIRSMKNMEMKIPEIERKTGLSAEIITQI